MIRGLVAQTPEIRVEEVDRLMSEIKNGRYKIDFEKVAESFLKEALIHEISIKSKGR